MLAYGPHTPVLRDLHHQGKGAWSKRTAAAGAQRVPQHATQRLGSQRAVNKQVVDQLNSDAGDEKQSLDKTVHGRSVAGHLLTRPPARACDLTFPKRSCSQTGVQEDVAFLYKSWNWAPASAARFSACRQR